MVSAWRRRPGQGWRLERNARIRNRMGTPHSGIPLQSPDIGPIRARNRPRPAGSDFAPTALRVSALVLGFFLAVPGALAQAFDDPETPACQRDALVVALDIGHTPTAPGATSARGRPEYAFNRDLARRVLDQMHASGLTGAFLIADGAPVPDLWDRPRRAAARGAHALISLHHDSVQPQYLTEGLLDGQPARFSRHARGHSLFVSGKNLYAARARRLAQAIGRALTAWGLTPTLHHAEPIPGENRTLLDRDLGVYDFPDLVVLKAAPMPAVLVEAGVIVHPEEETLLADPFHQDILAESITRGVLAVCTDLLAP